MQNKENMIGKDNSVIINEEDYVPYPLAATDCHYPLEFLDIKLEVQIDTLEAWLFRAIETSKDSIHFKHKGKDGKSIFYMLKLEMTKHISDNVKILALVINPLKMGLPEDYNKINGLNDYAIWIFELRRIQEGVTQLIIFWGSEFDYDEFDKINGFDNYFVRILVSLNQSFIHDEDKVMLDDEGSNPTQENTTASENVQPTSSQENTTAAENVQPTSSQKRTTTAENDQNSPSQEITTAIENDQNLPYDEDYREIFRLANLGTTTREISKRIRLRLNEPSINKIISEGRKFLGPNAVPNRRNRKRR